MSEDTNIERYCITIYITREVYDKGLTGYTCQYSGDDLITRSKDAFELNGPFEGDWQDAIELVKKHLAENIDDDSIIEADVQAWVQDGDEKRIVKRVFIHEDEL